MIRALLILLLLTAPTNAQEPACHNTLKKDKQNIEAKGWTWLGVTASSFVANGQWVYYKAGEFVLASPVVDGCVSPVYIGVGLYVEQRGV